GHFIDQTASAGLAAKRFRRTYSASFVDIDEDRDLDLIVVSDFAGLDLYLNDGRGRFTDQTREQVPEAHAFGMAHVLADFNRDGAIDLFMVGMNSYSADRLTQFHPVTESSPAPDRYRPIMAYGNRLLFRRQGKYVSAESANQVARSGWAWGATAADLDNDGYL